MKSTMKIAFIFLMSGSFIGSAVAADKILFRYNAYSTASSNNNGPSNPTNPENPTNPVDPTDPTDPETVDPQDELPPEWVTETDLGAFVGGVAVNIPVVATHPSSVVQTNKVSGPSWLIVSLDGHIMGLPPTNVYGDFPITVRALGPNKSVDQTFNITIHYAGSPTVSSPSPGRIEIGETMNSKIRIDWRNTPYTYENIVLSPGIYLNEEEDRIVGINTPPGIYSLSADIVSPYGVRYEIVNYTVEVVDTVPPAWPSNTLFLATIGQPFTHTPQVNDASMQPITIDVISAPPEFTYNHTTKQIEGTATEAEDYTVSLRATDTSGNSSTKDYTIRAVAPGTTSISFHGHLPVRAHYVGDPVSITIQFNNNIVITGTPSIEIEIGGQKWAMPFTSRSGNTLFFGGTIPEGLIGSGIKYTPKILLNGGSINNASTNLPADLRLPIIEAWRLNGVRFEPRP